MSSYPQHKLLHGILIPQFLESQGLRNTPKTRAAVKKAFKDMFEVDSTSSLSDEEYSTLISNIIHLVAEEFGVEIPFRDADQDMRGALKDVNNQYKQQNDGRG